VSKLPAHDGLQLEQLSSLIEDLLDVTRIAQGKMELRLQRTDLGVLLQRIADDYEALLRDARITLEARLPSDHIYADVDPTRVRQMVTNLLQNAAKFTPPDGTVTLELSRGANGARIEVSDTGAGIDAAKLDRLFEPFVQGQQDGARSAGGLGLGLAIVKGLASLHGGTVRAASAGLAHGAQFVIELPAAA
jgi:signal transduction histidine kinase